MGKGDAPLNFADLIENAQRRPTAPAPRGASDMSSPFEIPVPPDHHVVDDEQAPRPGGRIPGMPEYLYEAHVEYLVMPKQTEEYAEVLNKVLSGQAMLRFEERSFNKEGDCFVLICYMTRKENPKAEARRRAEEDDDDGIRRS